MSFFDKINNSLMVNAIKEILKGRYPEESLPGRRGLCDGDWTGGMRRRVSPGRVSGRLSVRSWHVAVAAAGEGLLRDDQLSRRQAARLPAPAAGRHAHPRASRQRSAVDRRGRRAAVAAVDVLPSRSTCCRRG